MKNRTDALSPAVSETLRLYHGWLSYLLTRLGEETVRVEADDLSRAIRELSCSVSKEGSAYIIRLGAAEGMDEQ